MYFQDLDLSFSVRTITDVFFPYFRSLGAELSEKFVWYKNEIRDTFMP